MEIQYKNYILRPTEQNDAESFYQLIKHNSERLTESFPKTIQNTQTPEQTREYLKLFVELTNKKEFFSFVICDTNRNNHLIGTAFIKSIDWNIPKGEIGYLIDRHYEGQGIISGIIPLLCQYCFTVLGFCKVFARVSPNNPSSLKPLLKAGFKEEGLIRMEFKTGNGELLDLVYLGLLKGEVNR